MNVSTGRSAGFLRRTLNRLAADDDELDEQHLQTAVESAGATPMQSCPVGERVCIAGTLKVVTMQPRAGAPALEAVLYDGTGSVTLVWLGRRRIAGIEPGRSLVARGRITRNAAGAVLYNPDYELRPTGWTGS